MTVTLLSTVTCLSQVMTEGRIHALLSTVAHVLKSLRLLETSVSSEEVESIVIRAFLESGHGGRRTMTTHEVYDPALCSSAMLGDHKEDERMVLP